METFRKIAPWLCILQLVLVLTLVSRAADTGISLTYLEVSYAGERNQNIALRALVGKLLAEATTSEVRESLKAISKGLPPGVLIVEDTNEISLGQTTFRFVGGKLTEVK